jgi:hypothetical protein
VVVVVVVVVVGVNGGEVDTRKSQYASLPDRILQFNLTNHCNTK